MTKARNLADLVDTTGNIILPNAGADATVLGIVDNSGSPLSYKNRTTYTSKIATSNCGGVIPTGNCTTAVTNGYKDANLNTTQTYKNIDGVDTYQPMNVAAPPNGNWWTWSGLGFTGVPTSNCGNPNGYNFNGGQTNTLFPLGTFNENILGSYTVTDEFLGSYRVTTANNCNCNTDNKYGNCYTNCNC